MYTLFAHHGGQYFSCPAIKTQPTADVGIGIIRFQADVFIIVLDGPLPLRAEYPRCSAIGIFV